MSEIKTTCRGTSRLIEVATMTHEEYLNLHTQGAKELRAAYEALQKKNDQWKTILNSNEQIRVAQAKRIDELEAEANKDYVKILRLKDALSAYGDPDIFADDED